MNIAVTGATSFIGVPIIQQLLKQGHQVYAIMRPGSVHAGRLPAEADNLHKIEMKLEELDQIAKIIPVPCHHFYHFGWEGAGSANRTNRQVQQQNVETSLKALEAARYLGCSHFLFSGSQAEYGICREAMTETTQCRPVSEYGKAKMDFSSQAAALTAYWRLEGAASPACIHARIFSIYGPGDHPWSLVESCLRAFRRGDYLSLGECTQMWNFLYIDDLAAALLLLMKKEPSEAYGVYNIAGPESATHSLREYVRQIYELCGSHGSYSYGRRSENAEGPANLIPDITKLEKEIQWRPEVSFEEGIHRLLETDPQKRGSSIGF